jgi:hypothetical protein
MRGQAAQFEQLESERLDLAQHAVQRGLVRDRTLQERVAAPRLSAQGRERAQHRGAKVTADEELVVRRLLTATSEAGHFVTSGLRGAKALTMLPMASRHRAAIRMENASTARKSPM